MSIAKKAIAAAIIATLPTLAFADEESTEIEIKGEIVDSCAITAPATVDFGLMDKNETKIETLTIKVQCGPGTSYEIHPHDGTPANYSFDDKTNPKSSNTGAFDGTLTDNDGEITYSVHADAAGTQPWSSSQKITDTGTGAEKSHQTSVKVIAGEKAGEFSLTIRPKVVF